MQIYAKEFYSSFAEVDEVVKDAINALRELNIRRFDRAEFRINFMLREILNNAVEHGNGFDRTKKVVLTIRYEGSVLFFDVQDEGKGIDRNLHGINDFVLRERNRGYEVIKNFEFDVLMDGSCVEISLNLNRVK